METANARGDLLTAFFLAILTGAILVLVELRGIDSGVMEVAIVISGITTMGALASLHHYVERQRNVEPRRIEARAHGTIHHAVDPGRGGPVPRRHLRRRRPEAHRRDRANRTLTTRRRQVTPAPADKIANSPNQSTILVRRVILTPCTSLNFERPSLPQHRVVSITQL